jgi:hypothetical protein
LDPEGGSLVNSNRLRFGGPELPEGTRTYYQDPEGGMHFARPGDEVDPDKVHTPPASYFIETGRASMVTASDLDSSSSTEPFNPEPSDSSSEPEAEQEEHV